jgi:hypothetical protein
MKGVIAHAYSKRVPGILGPVVICNRLYMSLGVFKIF